MELLATNLRRLGVLLSAVVLAVASLAISAAPVAAETYTVKMGADNGALQFVPSTVKISPGDSIKWEMNKLAPHNVIFDASGIPSKSAELAKALSKEKLLFSPGEAYVTEFPEAAPQGEYDFYCQPHRGAGMVGKVIVE